MASMLSQLLRSLAHQLNNRQMLRTFRTHYHVSPREYIFPKAFGDAAQDSYMESQETYTTLFEDQRKYNAIMSALAEVIYRRCGSNSYLSVQK